MAMVEKSLTSARNVVDFSRYRSGRACEAHALSGRFCRHCGAALMDGESEEECSSAFNIDEARLRWQAAQILRGLM
jgi:hypothetical protein